MTKEELMKRSIFIQGKPLPNKLKPLDIRTRGKNYVEAEAHISEEFDDFFEYENELAGIKPAREIASLYPYPDDPAPPHIEESLEEPKQDIIQEENINFDTGFVIMKKKTEPEQLNPNNIDNKDDESKRSFEFFQCQFVKEDGERCKKQAKKNQDLCATHKKFLAKIS
jgi:hypothetical protein